MRRGNILASFQGVNHLLVGALSLVLLAACGMPSLEDGSSLLTAPPGSNERAGAIKTPEPAMAQQSPTGATEDEQTVLLAATSAETPPPDDKILEPMPADGVMRGEFWQSSVAFANNDGLVCGGRLLGQVSELTQGNVVPVNCSDGSAGKVIITFLTSPDEIEGSLLLGESPSSRVRFVRSANLSP